MTVVSYSSLLLHFIALSVLGPSFGISLISIAQIQDHIVVINHESKPGKTAYHYLHSTIFAKHSKKHYDNGGIFLACRCCRKYSNTLTHVLNPGLQFKIGEQACLSLSYIYPTHENIFIRKLECYVVTFILTEEEDTGSSSFHVVHDFFGGIKTSTTGMKLVIFEK